MAPCQCPWCAEYSQAAVPPATQEDLLCDSCREPVHKLLVAAWLRLGGTSLAQFS